MLLKAGMTVRQAILYNVLSAMMAYLGMVTGILIGHYAENICMWIFALTAGLFMYVALVDMVSLDQTQHFHPSRCSLEGLKIHLFQSERGQNLKAEFRLMDDLL